MHSEFKEALLDLINPGLRFLVERPWRLAFTHGTRIVAPSLKLESAMVLVNHGEPELLLVNGEDPAIRLHFPRVREIAGMDGVYAHLGPDEIVPFPGRMEEEASVPLCACHVRQLAYCADALAAFFHAHGERVEKSGYEVRESRLVRGHTMDLEFPCLKMECQAPQEPQKPIQRRHHVGRNDPCPCGSGKKFKRCHWSQGLN